jgi:type VI protein secretion system component Hcp
VFPVRKILIAAVATSGGVLAVSTSLAASDYYLKIESVEGDTAARSESHPIELASWSFGATQASVAAPRDAATGQPTGKRQYSPIILTKPVERSAATAEESTVAAPAPAEAAASIQTVKFSVPEPGDGSTAELARMCASGKHIKSAELSSPSGRYQLQDAVISSCEVSGNQRTYEFRGHVTLMK